MSQPRSIFLPPILQVLQGLEEGQHQRFYTEGVSNVITWIDPNPVQVSTPSKRPKRPQTPLLMKTIDLRYGDPVKDGEEHFSFIVCFPEDEKDYTDTQTIYTQRTIKSRASSRSLRAAALWKDNVISGIKNAARWVIPANTTHAPESNLKTFQH